MSKASRKSEDRFETQTSNGMTGFNMFKKQYRKPKELELSFPS